MYNKGILEAIFKADLPRPLKLTFLSFARYARSDGREIWPGNEAIAQDLHCSELTIKRDTKRLLDGGWLLPDGKKGYTNRYWINMTKLGLPDTPLAQKPKIRGKIHLEKPLDGLAEGAFEHEIRPNPANLDAFTTATGLTLARMDALKRKIHSFWVMRQAGNPSARLSEPSRDELKAFVQGYKTLVISLDPRAGAYEIEAVRAETLLVEKGILIS